MKTKIKAWQFTLICLGLLASHHIKAGFNYEDYKNWINQKGYYYCHRSEDYPKEVNFGDLQTKINYEGGFNYLFENYAEYTYMEGTVSGQHYAYFGFSSGYLKYTNESIMEFYIKQTSSSSLYEGVPSYIFFQNKLRENMTFFDNRFMARNDEPTFNGYNFLRDVHGVAGIYITSTYPFNISQSYARGCKNLKIISFANAWWYGQDILLDCPNLETVRFTYPIQVNNPFPKLFNTYYDRTGTWYYPKLTTFVVPDAHYDAYVTEINKATSLVRDGHAYVIPESLYKCPRITGGVSLNADKVKLGKK